MRILGIGKFHQQPWLRYYVQIFPVASSSYFKKWEKLIRDLKRFSHEIVLFIDDIVS